LSNLLNFPHFVSCDEIAPWKILLLEKSWAKVQMAGRHFLKVHYENDIKIKNKFKPE
jgi:hypothetical protein